MAEEKTVELTYRPLKGGKFFAPALRPGATVQVSPEEAERLLATEQFTTPEQAQAEAEAAAKAAEAAAAAEPAPTEEAPAETPKRRGGK
jgi:hypothetical protein